MDTKAKRMLERMGYSPSEAAKAIGVSRQHIYALMAAGRLRSVKLGSRRIIPADALEALLAGSDDVAA